MKSGLIAEIAPQQKLSARDLSTIALSVGLLVVYFLPAEVLFHSPKTFCLHKLLLHFDCPACGTTRALNCLMHGKVQEALTFNIGIMPLTILILQHYATYLTPSKSLEVIRNITASALAVTLLMQYIIKTTQHFA